jgi:hypothetical protein
MTNSEFSSEFDVMYNNIMSNAAPGLDEYEKSVFLTKAQEQIVIELYGNTTGTSFEKDEEARRFLGNLVKTYTTDAKLDNQLGLSKTSVFFQIPEDVWFITYESAILKDERLGCLDGTEAVIVPVSQDYFYRIQKNPFRGPTKGRALRLDNADNIVEIVSDYNISKYLLRYLKRPSPIILVDLDTVGSELSINDVNTSTECELNPVIHRTILDRAVLLAKTAWSSGTGGN